MTSTVHLSFQYTERDYVRALRAHFKSRLRLRLDLFLVIVLAAIGVYLWPSWQGVASIVVAALFLLMLAVALLVIPPLAFRREPKFRDEYSLTFSPEGIHFRTAHVDSQLQWSMYSRALVDDHSYVLYYGSNQFTVIPKRVFGSAGDRRTFEALLTQHLGAIVQQGA